MAGIVGCILMHLMFSFLFYSFFSHSDGKVFFGPVFVPSERLSWLWVVELDVI